MFREGLCPQQTMVLSASNPQVCAYPAETLAKVPSGGDACPEVSSPQHSTVPSGRNPQVCQPPAETLAKVPSGGDACPEVSSPQHSTMPSGRNPQVCQPPAETLAKVPSGGDACPKWLFPQHTVSSPSVPGSHLVLHPSNRCPPALCSLGASVFIKFVPPTLNRAVWSQPASVPTPGGDTREKCHLETMSEHRCCSPNSEPLSALVQSAGVFYPDINGHERSLGGAWLAGADCRHCRQSFRPSPTRI